MLAAAAGALGGYYLGFSGARTTVRTSELASDLLVPATDYRDQRVRREAIRSELKRLMLLQAQSLAESGAYLTTDALLRASDGFLLRSSTRLYTPTALEGRRTEAGWVATLSHQESPDREACSVALGVDRAYAGGIPLRRPGRVRCSWDISTRLNRLW